MDTDTALREHPEFFEEYFGTVIPAGDNKFAALNTAVWSGGSFVYVPPGVHVEIPLQAYFRINTENMGQFERTLIIADEGSYVHYIEGCTAPIYKSDSLHSAVVEIIVKKNARVRYTTIQNWSNNVYNLVTKRAIAHEGATMEWIDGNIGSKVTMKYPSIFLVGEHAKGETLSVAFAGPGQHQDAGAKMIHMAPYTQSSIVSKSIARGGGRAGYRGEVRVDANAHHSANTVRCDALLVDTISRSDTYPAIDIRVDDVQLGHEATVSKVSEEQLFYLHEPRHARGRGDGDDRARLHRADRPRTAHGVRHGAQQAHRNGHGRIGRLDDDHDTGACRRCPVPRAHTDGAWASSRSRPVRSAPARSTPPTSSVPTGREVNWKHTPIDRHRRRCSTTTPAQDGRDHRRRRRARRRRAGAARRRATPRAARSSARRTCRAAIAWSREPEAHAPAHPGGCRARRAGRRRDPRQRRSSRTRTS